MTSRCTCSELRELTERCEQLADAVDAGHELPQRLMSEVARLREGFEAHRRGKQHVPGVFDDEGVTAMPVRGLGLSPTSELRLVLSALRSHLAADNRCAVTMLVRRR